MALHPHRPTSLDPDRWSSLGTGQQILHIASEMLLGAELFAESARPRLRSSYGRVTELVDLTLAVDKRPGLQRELGLFRQFIDGLRASEMPNRDEHRLALRVLLELHPDSQPHVALLGL